MSSKTKLIAAIGAAAVAMAVPLVKVSEGLVLQVKPDPIGRMAVCYGHDDQTMTWGARYTLAQCEAMLYDDLLQHAKALECITQPLTDGQKAAFVSFAFNVGNGAFCKSTLVRKANAGDLQGACAELSRWTYAGGKQLPGLVQRRKAERQLCERGVV